MDKTLHQLGGILLNGIPTFVLVLLLNVYLRFVFFKPLEKTLAERYNMTDGARKAAARALAKADARIAEHQAALRAARAEVYEAQEKIHRQLEEQQAAELQKAVHEADIMLRGARAVITKEVEVARQELAVQSEILADQIAASLMQSSLLKGKAA
jgi:F-type H+-transporting ATPase subunit b